MADGTSPSSIVRVREAFFFLALGALFTHEIDAMPNHEWRGLPVLAGLSDDVAMPIFVALHVPAFAIVVGLVASANPRTSRVARAVVAGFILVHAVLHALSMGHPSEEFTSSLSRLLIFGGAVSAAVWLALGRAARRR